MPVINPFSGLWQGGALLRGELPDCDANALIWGSLDKKTGEKR